MIADRTKYVVVGCSEVKPGFMVLAHEERDYLLTMLEKMPHAVLMADGGWCEVADVRPGAKWCIASICAVTTGADLPDDARELLGILGEECAEVCQVISKIQRFGLRVNPWTCVAGTEQLETELGDVLAMMFALSDERGGVGIINLESVFDHANEKLDALARPDGRLRRAEVKL